MKIKDLICLKKSDHPVSISGWVRTKRTGKNIAFITVNDGSTINNMQVVLDGDVNQEILLKKITTGCAIHIEGKLVSSKGEGQDSEILAKKITVLGLADVYDYPLLLLNLF